MHVTRDHAGSSINKAWSGRLLQQWRSDVAGRGQDQSFALGSGSDRMMMVVVVVAVVMVMVMVMTMMANVLLLALKW